MRGSVTTLSGLLLLALTGAPACTDKEGPSPIEYCEQPYVCPGTPHIDCMPTIDSPSPDICTDPVCWDWMVAYCGTVISV